jgi:YYY domain-containing protein
MRDAITWYVVVQVAGLAVWPLLARAMWPLSDRGWAASKAAGVLGLAWLTWLACMLSPLPFARVTLLVVLLALAVTSWGAAYRHGLLDPLREWIRCRRGLLLGIEATFAVVFVLFAVFRAHAPAVIGTEKPMDMAFLNGFMAAQRLPTEDSWLAGYSVPYYYFGYFVLACIAKVAGVEPGVAYNLAAAIIPALTAPALASLTFSIATAARVRASWAALGAAAATLFGLFCGNLSTFFEFLVARGTVGRDIGTTLEIKNFADGVIPGVWPPANSFWWFHASRIIPNLQPDGINEFPFFSALLSDLHPHFVALPFELLVLSVGVTHVLSHGASLRSWLTQSVAAVSLGALLVMNTWDIAPFWLLFIGLSLLAALRHVTRPGDQRYGRWLLAVAPPFMGALLYSPYFVGYSGPPLGLGIVSDRTPVGSMVVLFGWAMSLLVLLGLFERWCLADRMGWVITGAGALLGVLLAVFGQPTLGVLVALAGVLLPTPSLLGRGDPGTVVAVVIGAFAAAMLLGVELIYLDDVFHSRMNTVFKFHVNAWLLASVAGGAGLALVGHFLRRARWLACGVAGLFLVAGLVYPLTATITRMQEKPAGGLTLDGIAFLSADERAAIRWLSAQNGPNGRAVIAEAVGKEYSSGARMATYAGAVGVLGWPGHELQWRGALPALGAREADMAALYGDAPPEQIRAILDRYRIQYIVVGEVEREIYGAEVELRFPNVLPLAFRSGAVAIFRSR